MREQSLTHLCPAVTAPVTQQLDAEATSMCRLFMCFINMHISVREVTSDEWRWETITNVVFQIHLCCVSVWGIFVLYMHVMCVGRVGLDAVFFLETLS